MQVPTAYPLLLGVAVAAVALIDRQRGSASMAAVLPEVDPQDVEQWGAVLTGRHLGGYDLTFAGKSLGHFGDRDAAVAAYRREAKRTGRWVDFYESDDLGGLVPLDEHGDRGQPWR